MLSIVLARRDFREYDQIISVYTRQEGKHELLARGVKKITSKNSAHLEPFSIVDIEIAHGKEIDHVTKVQPVEYFANIRNNLEKSLMAGYVVSLLNTLLREKEKDEHLFDMTFSLFEFINFQFSIFNFQVLLDSFVVKFLKCLGFSMFESSGIEKWKDILQIMENGDLEEVNKLEYDEHLHRKIYEFLVYQTERKVPDWAKTCIF
ncbi:MAG: DNA repair protein RecO [Candidatus Magasanikbacteria bacterium]